MPITPVTTAQIAGSPTGGTSSSVNTTGAALLVFGISYQSGTTPTVSDNYANTWTGLTVGGFGTASARTRIYYCENPAVGTGHTFTISGSGIFASGNVSAWASAATSSVFDVQVQGGADNQAVQQIGTSTLTPTNPNELLISATSVEASAFGYTAAAGWTSAGFANFSGGSNYGNAAVYQIQTTATAITSGTTVATFGGSTTIYTSISSAAFKEASGGGVTFALTGVAETGAAGALKSASAYGLTGVAGATAVGSLINTVGQGLSGNQVTGNVGILSSSITIALTGVQTTGAVGTLSAGNDITKALTGVGMTGQVGTLGVNILSALIGVQALGAAGTLTASGPTPPPAPDIVAGPGGMGRFFVALLRTLH